MRAPADWLAATLLIGLIGPARAVSTAMVSLEPPMVWPPETTRPAIAQQSPIDIRGDDLQLVKKPSVPSLAFHYGTHATVDLENTGSPNEEATVRANVASGDGEVRVGDRVYRLVQFHWHTPAEHEVDEQRYPLRCTSFTRLRTGRLWSLAYFSAPGVRTRRSRPSSASFRSARRATRRSPT